MGLTDTLLILGAIVVGAVYYFKIPIPGITLNPVLSSIAPPSPLTRPPPIISPAVVLPTIPAAAVDPYADHPAIASEVEEPSKYVTLTGPVQVGSHMDVDEDCNRKVKPGYSEAVREYHAWLKSVGGLGSFKTKAERNAARRKHPGGMLMDYPRCRPKDVAPGQLASELIAKRKVEGAKRRNAKLRARLDAEKAGIFRDGPLDDDEENAQIEDIENRLIQMYPSYPSFYYTYDML